MSRPNTDTTETEPVKPASTDTKGTESSVCITEVSVLQSNVPIQTPLRQNQSNLLLQTPLRQSQVSTSQMCLY